MESSPQGRLGDNFIGPWGTLNFHLPLGAGGVGGLGGLSQMGVLKFFTFEGEQRDFPHGGEWWNHSPTC